MTLLMVSVLGACSKAHQARVAVYEKSMVSPARWRNIPNKYDAELHKMGMPPAPPLYIAPPPLPHPKNTKSDALVSFGHHKIHGISFYQTTIDLSQKSQYMSILLPHDVAEANSVTVHHGAENFAEYVRLHKCAVMTNGTFFSKDKQERVLGNLRTDNQSLKYSPWEDYGTTFAIKKDNVLEMVTALAEGKPRFDTHIFSLTCGPRLLRRGKIWVHPTFEGFHDAHVLTVGPRQALGYSADGKRIYLVSFLTALSLEKAAEMMATIGCAEAMNLDGGASRALAHDGKILIEAGRPLTNVIVVYDRLHPAPAKTIRAWEETPTTLR